jgi:cob(I)alamin adenosyltransferase
MEKGYVHIYTGDGKGKTTASLGLALRAYGAGLKVFIGQFVKGMDYSELYALEKFSDRITVKQFGRANFIHSRPDREDMEAAARGWKESVHAATGGEYDLVILDELNIAIYFGLISTEEVIDLIRKKYEGTELVITGRKMPEKLAEYADLITEMKEVKHYYNDGVEARAGIEK